VEGECAGAEANTPAREATARRRAPRDAVGTDGVTVATEQDLSNALTAALQSRRTTVTGVRTDASGYVAQFNALREL